jgi:electron transport protein HydN
MMEHDPIDGVPIPRLTLIKTYRISAPVGCHHCQDAPCVAACPQSALYSSEGVVGIRQERCIGCSNCVLACPFGAVEITSSARTVSRDGFEYEIGRKPVVIKCDLCVNRADGPACVRACLTNALGYVDEDRIETLSRSKQRAAAEVTELVAGVTL